MVLPWQQQQTEQVFAQIHQGLMPHAYLFNGPEGVGKRSFATYLASWLLCEGDKGKGAPCGNCKQCRLTQAGTHGDLRIIEPDENSRIIKVDTIRSLSVFVSQSSNQGGKKVVILAPAESLNVNAANALLKTLEEPTPNTLIILVSHLSGRLLPTIRSRCQVVDFYTPPHDQAISWLSAKGVQPGDEAPLLSLSEGAPLRALALNEQGALVEYETMQRELGAVLKRDVSPSLVAERWGDDLADLRLKWLIKWLSELCASKLSGKLVESGQHKKMFVYIRDKASDKSLFSLYDESLKQLHLVQGASNPNRALLFEHLFQGWIDLIRNN